MNNDDDNSNKREHEKWRGKQKKRKKTEVSILNGENESGKKWMVRIKNIMIGKNIMCAWDRQ